MRYLYTCICIFTYTVLEAKHLNVKKFMYKKCINRILCNFYAKITLHLNEKVAKKPIA